MILLVKISLLGYGGTKKPEDFFARVDQLNPDLVVDVRANPHRAYRGTYTKTHLEKTLKEKYLWVPELGNKTRDINNIQLVDEEKGLQKLSELAAKHEHIVLLCAEKRDEDCHRSYVKKRLAELLSNM